MAAEVYDLVNYKDLKNKSKIRSALKKLGKGTDPLTVGRVIRKIEDEIKENTNYEDFDDDVPVHPHRHEIVSWDDHYDNIDEDDEDELEERIIKKDVVRDGKKVKISKSDRDDSKMVKGKEIKMTRDERKARSDAASDREKTNPNISKKRQPSFKKSIDVKRGMKRTDERRRRRK